MLEPVRVLYVIDSLAVGGAETSLASMAPHLAAAGIELHVCYFLERDGVHDELRRAGSTLHHIAAGRARRVQALRGLIADIEPDLVHTTLFEADQVGRIAGRLCRLPVVSSIVSTGFELGSWHSAAGVKSRMAVAVDAATARAVTAFHAVSAPVADVTARRLHVRRDRFSVIPRGRDPELLGRHSAGRRSAVRARLGFDDDTPLVVAIGREVLPKGHVTLLDATPRIAAEVDGVRILIAGRRGDRSDELDRRVSSLGIGHVVDRLGHRDDVPDLLAAADVLAFPSTREGFPGTLVEALALECPIVASDIPAIRSVVADRDAPPLASLVPVGDSGALASATIERLRERPAEALLSAGRAAFERDFTTSAVADRMAAFHRAVLDRPGLDRPGLDPNGAEGPTSRRAQ